SPQRRHDLGTLYCRAVCPNAWHRPYVVDPDRSARSPMSQPPTPPPPQHKRLARPADAVAPGAARPERSFTGIPIAPGVAIGPVFSASEPKVEVTRHKIQAADTPAEGARFDAAITQSRKQLLKLRARLAI